MPRILCIDLGLKRSGIAVTDPLKIISSALATVETATLMKFLKDYVGKEAVELFLIGDPKNLDGSDTHATRPVAKFIQQLQMEFPLIPIETIDERYSSKRASQAMIDMGMKKMQRRDKGMIDQIAAAMMLQEYLSNRT